MKWLLWVPFVLATYEVLAQQIYKSIDKNGNVSYSSEPVTNAVEVETVTPPPKPSLEEVEHAQRRYRELEARDSEREKERREQDRDALQRQQIRADRELMRQLTNQKPANVIVINQNPYYWGRGYRPRWRKPIKPEPRPIPEQPVQRKFLGPSKLPGSTGSLLKR